MVCEAGKDIPCSTPLDIVCGEPCPLLLDLRTPNPEYAQQGICFLDSANAYRTLVEFEVFRSRADMCDRNPIVYCNNSPGGGIIDECPELGRFILENKPHMYRNLKPGTYCYRVRVTYPLDPIVPQGEGLASVSEDSQVVTITGADTPTLSDPAIMYLGTNIAANYTPFLVDAEVIAKEKGFLKPYADACCSFSGCKTLDAGITLEPGPTGNIIALNTSFETESDVEFAIFEADYYYPVGANGKLTIKGSTCC